MAGGKIGLRAPVVEALRADGPGFYVSGAWDIVRCERCEWPMVRDPALDGPALGLEGGEWRAWRCAADERHVAHFVFG